MRKRLKIDTLNSQWHDQDQIMLHAAFQCLVDFIEKEKPGEVVEDWKGMGAEAWGAWLEMNRLYWWWKTREHAIWCEEEDDMDDVMLKRLVAIRGYLWT
jgi:hypothetical protein